MGTFSVLVTVYMIDIQTPNTWPAYLTQGSIVNTKIPFYYVLQNIAEN